MHSLISQIPLLVWLPILGCLSALCIAQPSNYLTIEALKRGEKHTKTALIEVQEADNHWFTNLSIGGQVFSILIDTGSSAL